MVEEAKKRVPQVRFKGFDGGWDEKVLGDEPGEIIAGGDIDNNRLFDVGLYPVLANALTNDGVVGYYRHDYRVKAPAVTVTGRGDVGHAKARVTNFTPVVRLLSVKTGHDVHFLENAINIHEVLVESTGVPQLTVPQLEKYNISFPSSIDEESKIGTYFQELDRLIGLHQRKHEKLVTLKKAMLKKMFPAPGATTPEIRFKEFSKPWVEKMLGEICEEFHSGKFISAKDIKNTGMYPVYGGNGFRGYSNSYNHDGLYSLIGRQGALCGNMNLSFGKAFFTEHAVAIKANSKNDTMFLFYLLGKMELGQYSDQSAQPGLAVGKLQKLCTSVPSIDEQQKIGTYFRQLDELIKQHGTQLEKLKQFKAACLEKMFV